VHAAMLTSALPVSCDPIGKCSLQWVLLIQHHSSEKLSVT